MKVVKAKHFVWTQFFLEYKGNHEGWLKLVGAITLMEKRFIVRSPVFMDDKVISVFIKTEDEHEVKELIEKEVNGE